MESSAKTAHNQPRAQLQYAEDHSVLLGESYGVHFPVPVFGERYISWSSTEFVCGLVTFAGHHGDVAADRARGAAVVHLRRDVRFELLYFAPQGLQD